MRCQRVGCGRSGGGFPSGFICWLYICLTLPVLHVCTWLPRPACYALTISAKRAHIFHAQLNCSSSFLLQHFCGSSSDLTCKWTNTITCQPINPTAAQYPYLPTSLPPPLPAALQFLWQQAGNLIRIDCISSVALRCILNNANGFSKIFCGSQTVEGGDEGEWENISLSPLSGIVHHFN